MSAFWLVPWLAASIPQTIPVRPEELRFDELRFDVPDPGRYRHELSNGVPVYVAPDSTFPLVRVGIQLRQGSYLEPENRVGLAGLTGSLLRTGGTSRLDPGAFDEEVEYLAAGISSSVTGASVTPGTMMEGSGSGSAMAGVAASVDSLSNDLASTRARMGAGPGAAAGARGSGADGRAEPPPPSIFT